MTISLEFRIAWLPAATACNHAFTSGCQYLLMEALHHYITFYDLTRYLEIFVK